MILTRTAEKGIVPFSFLIAVQSCVLFIPAVIMESFEDTPECLMQEKVFHSRFNSKTMKFL